MKIYTSTFKAMGGLNDIVVAAQGEEHARHAMDAAVREVLRIESKYSRYRAGSVVARINEAAGRDTPVSCDPESIWLLNCAGELYRQSDGLFDATSGILRRAWDFSKPVLPSEQTLAPLLALVGWEGVELSEAAVRLTKPGMQIDFGGFGKEYAADRAARIISEFGIAHGYVSLGGDISVVGPQPDSSPWQIGVQNPRQRGQAIAKIEMSKGGLATSSDSEKYFDIGGQRYCHILNPKTGYPVHCWTSVSIKAPTALQAGCLSTIAMLKECAGPAFIRRSNCPSLFVDLDGQIFSNEHPVNKESERCRPQL
jgi:thiamine biosynthesis lipoprotein